MELDAFDRQLLHLVQEDAGQTAERLALQVDLSPSAIQRRLRKLKEEGVIAREVAIIDPGSVGNPIFCIVSVSVESERPELLARFRKWISEQALVQQAYYVTGEVDFVLVVTAPEMESFDSLMTRMVNENSNVRRFTTNVTLGVVKRGLTIPVR